MQQELKLNSFQRRALSVPESIDLFLGGGRGGGKSYLLAVFALRHGELYGNAARMLYLRQTYKGVVDFEFLTRDLFGTVYGSAARYNAQEHLWRLPNGATLELGQLESAADYGKYQGRSFTLLLVDEAGQCPDARLLDLMRSNLRGPPGVLARTVLAANPGGPGHFWLAKRFVFRERPWLPFEHVAIGREVLYAPSTFADNEFIDREEYARQLQAACATDAELLRAWTTGDWAVQRGAYFAAVLDEARNAVDPWTEIPRDWERQPWETWLAHDFGSTAPSVTLLFARSPGQDVAGRFYPRGSLVIVDELAAVRPDSLSQGLGWTAATTAEAIVDFAKQWKVRPEGAADDAIFAKTGATAGSIADEFTRKGVYLWPAKKGTRIAGWEMMKRLLADAGKLDVPGLYVSRRCEYFWATVPYLARDPKRIEDVDSSGADHAADACRYGLMRERRHVILEPLRI